MRLEAAPSAEAEEVMQALSHDLMSPYCPGRTIATCPSPNARKLEAQILEQAEAGRSREQIEAALAERFPGIRGYVGRPELIWDHAAAAVLAWIDRGGPLPPLPDVPEAALLRRGRLQPGRVGVGDGVVLRVGVKVRPVPVAARIGREESTEP